MGNFVGFWLLIGVAVVWSMIATSKAVASLLLIGCAGSRKQKRTN